MAARMGFVLSTIIGRMALGLQIDDQPRPPQPVGHVLGQVQFGIRVGPNQEVAELLPVR